MLENRTLLEYILLVLMLMTVNADEVNKMTNEQLPAYNQEQYKLLKKCSNSRDVSKWNEWRKTYSKQKVDLTGANLSGFWLEDINFIGANLEAANLEQTNLKKARLVGARLCRANMRLSDLEEAQFTEADLTEADLTKANLKNASLCVVKMQRAILRDASLAHADIQMAHLENTDFTGADFRHAYLNKTSLENSTLRDVTFENAIVLHTDLKGADLSNVEFTKADLSHSNLWHAKFEIKDIAKANSLFHTKILLDNFDEYLFLKDHEILFCYERQYKHLLKCSEEKDLSEWNARNPWAGYFQGTKRIFLAGADLEGAFLQNARLWNADLREARFVGTDLKGADLEYANLEGSYMNNSPCFDGASLGFCNLQGSFLGSATFRNTRLFGANLANADLGIADFSGADLRRTNLKDTKSSAANFCKANLWEASLSGADFYKCNFCSVNLRRVTVDSSTRFYQCQVDFETDFRCVPLDGIGIDSTTKRILEYNIRRKNWNDWYWRATWDQQKKISRKNILRFIASLPVRLFWWVSDYGTSVKRILFTFCMLVFLFATIYYKYPEHIENLVVKRGVSSEKGLGKPLFIRSVYFSVVTMTTLGFGDIHPAAKSRIGHILIIIQVLLGYFLLAEFVTYLGTLFTSGGPFLIYTFPRSGFP